MRSLISTVVVALIVALISAFDLLSLIPYFGRMHYGDVAYIYGVMNTITLWGIIAALYWHLKTVMLPRLTGWNKHYERFGDVKRAEEARYTARFLHIVILILAGTALSLTLKAFGIQPTSAMGNVQITPSEVTESSYPSCDAIMDAALVKQQRNVARTGEYVENGAYIYQRLLTQYVLGRLTPIYPDCVPRWEERFEVVDGKVTVTDY